MQHLIRSVALAALAGMISGCGSSAKNMAPASADYAMAEPEEATASDETFYSFEDGEAAFEDEVIAGNLAGTAEPAPPSAPVMAKKEAPRRIESDRKLPPPPPRTAEKKPEKVQVKPDQMVMYTGYLKLRVKRLLDSMDEITRLAKEKGGYVESMTERVIILRIPKGDFEGAMAAFRALGDLLDERIESLDVTEQFTDLAGRLIVAKEARERLIKLLEEVKDVTERLRIMQEIKRLTEEIETIESRLKTLQNLVDYFTITIELVPVLETRGVQHQRSPFPWIQQLSAHTTTLPDGKDEIAMTLPKGFVLFDEAETYRARAADTTIIRAGVVDNEPRGDNPFWMDAVHHEMVGRSEIEEDSGTAGKLSFRLYRSDDITPRYYLIGVYTVGEDLYVVEVFYPDEESKNAHHRSVVEALKTFEVK